MNIYFNRQKKVLFLIFLSITSLGIFNLSSQIDQNKSKIKCKPTLDSKINGSLTNRIILIDNRRINLNWGESLTCNDKYFVSVQQIERQGKSYGPENKKWMNLNELNQFGSWKNFDLKQFNSSFNNFTFEKGRSYKIKVGVGSPLEEKIYNVRITKM